ncbi:unnamed protein product [Eruca vesicaria subsp. sativa]|uniref:Uncharacterized protein n=1 Tax=Eruca vesicaria subsp. sativa TaxID=29727 RepID=A0ABC8LKQ3_ERUVS|nr:unnamed protein product [Eruca vesicaria subsp. sativa]
MAFGESQDKKKRRCRDRRSRTISVYMRQNYREKQKLLPSGVTLERIYLENAEMMEYRLASEISRKRLRRPTLLISVVNVKTINPQMV